MVKDIHAIILAAGKGTRMKTDIPKCAYPFLGESMIKRIVNTCKSCGIKDITVVVGYKKEVLMDILGDTVSYAYQEEQLGTAHACLMAKENFKNKKGNCLIFPGDMPLIDKEIIESIVSFHCNNNLDFTILSTVLDDAASYGRIVRKDNKVVGILEKVEIDKLNDDESIYGINKNDLLKINEINTAFYCANLNILFPYLDKISDNNAKHEFFLTDIVSILLNDHKKVDAFLAPTSPRLMGINDLETLEVLEKFEKNN